MSLALTEALADYLNHVRAERGLSANTVAAYRRDLNRYVGFLAGRGVTQVGDVTTVDISEVGARKARVLAQERGVELDIQVADLADWVQGAAALGPWDAIVSIFCHLPSGLRYDVARALTPQLAPTGKLIMEAYTPAQPSMGSGGPKDEDLLMTRQKVVNDWPGLLLDVRITERRIFEGMGHQGLSSVIQVLGQPRRD